MIVRTSQLKTKIKNLSNGNSNKAQALLRTFFMERFLERLCNSDYKNNFYLKGGMLVSSLLGLDVRSTMDIDTTISEFNLDYETAKRVIEEIINIDINDEVTFEIIKEGEIMDEADYPGIRFTLQANLEKIKQKIKIDISTGDIITPSAIEYNYKLMLEDKTIQLRSYNIETLLAEKIETIMARGITNTRMRDFYDIYQIYMQREDSISFNLLKKAFENTSKRRKSYNLFSNIENILYDIQQNEEMMLNWENYKNDSHYVGELSWKEVNETIQIVIKKMK